MNRRSFLERLAGVGVVLGAAGVTFPEVVDAAKATPVGGFSPADSIQAMKEWSYEEIAGSLILLICIANDSYEGYEAFIVAWKERIKSDARFDVLARAWGGEDDEDSLIAQASIHIYGYRFDYSTEPVSKTLDYAESHREIARGQAALNRALAKVKV